MYDAFYRFKVVDQYSGPLGKIIASTKKAQDAINKMSRTTDTFGSRFTGAVGKFGRNAKKMVSHLRTVGMHLGQASSKMTNFRTIVGAGIAMAALRIPVQRAVSFESRMIDVARVQQNITSAQKAQLSGQIQRTAVQYGMDPDAVAGIAYEAGKVGTKVSEMDEFVKLVSRTAVAFDVLEKEAGRSIGTIKTRMKLTVDETGNLLDAVNYLADNTSATGKRTIEIIERTVGTMGLIKMPPEAVAGWAAFADQLEVTPELAASGLDMFVRKMQRMPGMMKYLLKDPSGTLKATLRHLKKTIAKEDLPTVLKSLFGEKANRMISKMINNLGLMDTTFEKSGKGAGSMMAEFTKQQKAAEAAIGRMKAGFAIIAEAIGKTLLPDVKDLGAYVKDNVFAFKAFIEQHSGLVRIAAAVTGIVASVVGLGILIGVISSITMGFAALFTPIGMVLGGLVLIAGALGYMSVNSEKVRESNAKLSAAFGELGEYLDTLWGVENKVEDSWLYTFVEWITSGAIDFAAEKVREFTTDLKTSIDNWNAIVKYFKGSWFKDIVAGGEAKLKQELEFQERRPPINQGANSQSQLQGTIKVQAEPGTKVTSAKINAVGADGNNLADYYDALGMSNQ